MRHVAIRPTRSPRRCGNAVGAFCFGAALAAVLAHAAAAAEPAHVDPARASSEVAVPARASSEVAVPARAPGPRAPASVRLQTDVIAASSELPKVLYIVPWRAADSAQAQAAPQLGNAQLFQSLDPDAHRRLLHYRQLLGDTPTEAK